MAYIFVSCRLKTDLQAFFNHQIALELDIDGEILHADTVQCGRKQKQLILDRWGTN